MKDVCSRSDANTRPPAAASLLFNRHEILLTRDSQRATSFRQVHNIAELQRVLKLELDSATTILGINNRDLKTFEVTLENTRIIMDSPAGQQASNWATSHTIPRLFDPA